jgi:uncharacterized membrane protein YgcG
MVSNVSSDIKIKKMEITVIGNAPGVAYGIHDYGQSQTRVNQAKLVIVKFKYKSTNFASGDVGAVPYMLIFKDKKILKENITDEIRGVKIGQAFLGKANARGNLFPQFKHNKVVDGIKYSRQMIAIGFLKSIFNYLQGTGQLPYVPEKILTEDPDYEALPAGNDGKLAFKPSKVKTALINSINIILQRVEEDPSLVEGLELDSDSGGTGGTGGTGGSSSGGGSGSSGGGSGSSGGNRNLPSEYIDPRYFSNMSPSAPAGRGPFKPGGSTIAALDEIDKRLKYRKYKGKGDASGMFIIIAWDSGGAIRAAYYKDKDGTNTYKKMGPSYQNAALGDLPGIDDDGSTYGSDNNEPESSDDGDGAFDVDGMQ